MMRKLVPVDGSEQACRAAAWADKMAKQTGDGVMLLHVFDLNAAEAMALANLNREEIAERIAAHAAPSFEKARAAMTAGAECETQAVIGSPADEIIRIAAADGIDHIVMGSRGLSGLRELMLGSVSEKVLHRAPCAVTIIR
jgi:nucleotide-binding universal stress UspA family protein